MLKAYAEQKVNQCSKYYDICLFYHLAYLLHNLLRYFLEIVSAVFLLISTQV